MVDITAHHLIGGSAPPGSLGCSQEEGDLGGHLERHPCRQTIFLHTQHPATFGSCFTRKLQTFFWVRSLTAQGLMEQKCVGQGAGWARAASRGQFIALVFRQILSDVEHFTRKHLVRSLVLAEHHRDV